MDKFKKFLNKINRSEKALLLKILADLRVLNLADYDVKAMSGYKGLFRLKKGKVRIIFLKNAGRGVLIEIGMRGDVYKKL